MLRQLYVECQGKFKQELDIILLADVVFLCCWHCVMDRDLFVTALAFGFLEPPDEEVVVVTVTPLGSLLPHQPAWISNCPSVF